MPTASERREKIYQIDIRWIKDAIAYVQSLLDDQYESNLYYSAIKKQTKVPNDNPNPDAVVAEIGKQFTVILSQNKDEVERVDSAMSVIRKELVRAHYKNCRKV